LEEGHRASENLRLKSDRGPRPDDDNADAAATVSGLRLETDYWGSGGPDSPLSRLVPKLTLKLRRANGSVAGLLDYNVLAQCAIVIVVQIAEAPS
jgi:hypothetical protein